MRRRLVFIGLVTCLIGIAIPRSLSADTIVLAQATFDWKGFTFATTPGLAIDRVQWAGISTGGSAQAIDWGAATNPPTERRDSDAVDVSGFNRGGLENDLSFSAATSLANAGGSGFASAWGTDDGMVQSQSLSSTFGESPSHIQARSAVSASEAFWLYAHGTGTLSVSIPYTLQILVSARPDTPDALNNDLIEAISSVSFHIGPGASFGGVYSDSIHWSRTDPLKSGLLTKSGKVTLSRNFQEPTWGPLVGIFAQADTSATAIVPEPASGSLFGLALVLCSVFYRSALIR